MDPRAERPGAVLAGMAFLLAAYAAWARGGTPPTVLPPLLFGGLLLLGATALAPVLAKSEPPRRPLRETWRVILSDPLFWLGWVFLSLLAVQWWNSGRHPVFDPIAGRWGYSPPPHAGWPSSVARHEAFEMVCWFLPAWAVTLAVRSPWLTRRQAWGLLYALAANAAVLAAFGTCRFLAGRRTLWGVPGEEVFFATFGYINHGSAFFVLASALAVGLLMRECFNPVRRPRAWVTAAILATALFNIVGVHLSFCRAGMVFAWVFVLVAGIYGVRRSRRELIPVRQAYLAIAVVGVALVAFLAIGHLAHREIVREMTNKTGQAWFSPVQDFVEQRDRSFVAAWSIWKDSPWFGVGGWGFSHYLSCYLPRSQWSWAARPGWANVHNDPLQFLVEFGVAGAGLLAAAVCVLVASVLRSGAWRRGAALMVLLGCGMVWLHSLIDLPFRCPAILLTWTALLAVLPVLRGGGVSAPRADGCSICTERILA